MKAWTRTLNGWRARAIPLLKSASQGPMLIEGPAIHPVWPRDTNFNTAI
jgi:hypothetical protein